MGELVHRDCHSTVVFYTGDLSISVNAQSFKKPDGTVPAEGEEIPAVCPGCGQPINWLDDLGIKK